MPVFQITAPDGRKFKVTGPAGFTKEQALARIRSQYAQRRANKEQNPAEYDPASPQYQAKYGPKAVPFGENFSAGVGKSFVDTGRGIRQLYANIADAVAPQSPNLTSLVTGQPNTRSATIQSEIDASRERDAPLMSTGAGTREILQDRPRSSLFRAAMPLTLAQCCQRDSLRGLRSAQALQTRSP
ncbi:MAG: hypothetical protein IPO08_25190 [Xanthomonadales bacterium]|nr:hypothetical protein [Xanthomonadales bacterium]